VGTEDYFGRISSRSERPIEPFGGEFRFAIFAMVEVNVVGFALRVDDDYGSFLAFGNDAEVDYIVDTDRTDFPKAQKTRQCAGDACCGGSRMDSSSVGGWRRCLK